MMRRFVTCFAILILAAQSLALAGSETGSLADYNEEIQYEIDLFGYGDEVIGLYDEGAAEIAAGTLSYDGYALSDFYTGYLIALKRNKLHDRADEALLGYLATERARVEGEIAYSYASDANLISLSQLYIMNVGIYGRDCGAAIIGELKWQGGVFRELEERMIEDQGMAAALQKRLGDAAALLAGTNAQLFFATQGKTAGAAEIADKTAELEADYEARAAQGDLSWMGDDGAGTYLIDMNIIYLIQYAALEVQSTYCETGEDPDAYAQLFEEQFRQRCGELMLAVAGNEAVAAALMEAEEADITNWIDTVRILCDPAQLFAYCAAADDSDTASTAYLVLYFNYRTGQIGLDAFNQIVAASPYDVVVSVESVTADGGKNGFQAGDRILTVNGESVVDIRQVLIAFSECGTETCDVAIERGGQTVTVSVPTTEPALGVSLSLALTIN